MAITEEMRGVLNLISYLRKRPGAELGEIARFLRCTEKEVEQYLRRVILCGVPPYYPHDYIGVHRDGEKITLSFGAHFRRPLRLTLPEALSLAAVLQQHLARSSAPHEEAIQSLLEKLEDMLSSGDQATLKSLVRRVAVQEGRGMVGPRIEQIEKAIAETKVLELEYYSPRSRALSRRKLRPYSVIYQGGDWYLAAHDVRKRQVQSFRVDRIKSIQVLEETFTVPEDFRPEDYRPRDLYEPLKRRVKAEVRFSPSIAPWIREGTPERNLKEQKDGSVIVTIYAETTEFLISWVLQYGDAAEILQPTELRRCLAEQLDGLIASYAAR
ncbi:MAG: WYL domain-containing protein [Planctomycetota bacterium]|nr:WYL domain-containing protein [Planctomycetota bacterium]